MVNLTDVPKNDPEESNESIEVNDVSSPKITEEVNAASILHLTSAESTQAKALPFEEQIKQLTVAFDALSKNYVDFRTSFSRLQSTVTDLKRQVQELQSKNVIIRYRLKQHKHAVSGEAMIPIDLLSIWPIE